MAFESVISWWRQITGNNCWRIHSTVGTPADVPSELPDMAAVIVGTEQKPQSLVLDCPCGAGHRITVNLNSANTPHWKILQKQKLSVYPSIEEITASKRCHFMITNGNVIWVQTTKK